MVVTTTTCVFCEIVAGRLDAHIVHESDDVVAFLDVHPVFAGHTLVVPRIHHETILDLDDRALASMFRVVRDVAGAIVSPDGLSADGTWVAQNNVISQSVPHVHVHVVPRHRKDGLRGFFWPRTRYSSDAEAAEVAARIAAGM